MSGVAVGWEPRAAGARGRPGAGCKVFPLDEMRPRLLFLRFFFFFFFIISGIQFSFFFPLHMPLFLGGRTNNKQEIHVAGNDCINSLRSCPLHSKQVV